jgi:hypothetical protein
MVLDTNRQLRQRVLVDRPVRQLCRHFLKIGQNYSKARRAQVPEVGAIHQMLHGTFRIRAVGQQLERVVNVAGGRVAPQTPIRRGRFIEVFDLFGAPDTNRTCDPPLRRGMLYPLSYGGVGGLRRYNLIYKQTALEKRREF